MFLLILVLAEEMIQILCVDKLAGLDCAVVSTVLFGLFYLILKYNFQAHSPEEFFVLGYRFLGA